MSDQQLAEYHQSLLVSSVFWLGLGRAGKTRLLPNRLHLLPRRGVGFLGAAAVVFFFLPGGLEDAASPDFGCMLALGITNMVTFELC